MLTLAITTAQNDELEAAAAMAVNAVKQAHHAALVAGNGNTNGATRELNARRDVGNRATRAFRYNLTQFAAKYSTLWSIDALLDYWLTLAADAEALCAELGGDENSSKASLRVMMAQKIDAEGRREMRAEARMA